MVENQGLKVKHIGPPVLCCEYAMTVFTQAVVYRQFTQYIGPVVRDVSIMEGRGVGGQVVTVCLYCITKSYSVRLKMH